MKEIKAIFKLCRISILDEAICTKRQQKQNAIDEYGALSPEADRAEAELDRAIDARMKEGILNAR